MVPSCEENRVFSAQLTKVTETRSFVDSAHHLYPEIASEARSIYTNGADPKYEALPPKGGPDDGRPHGPRSTQKLPNPCGKT